MATWIQSSFSGTVTSVTAADTSVVVTGTPTVAPTLATGTLDVIAADHPPAANWSNNSHKITGLANGTAASDAGAFGQIPTSAGTIGGLLAANNLSDVASQQTALNNLAGSVAGGTYARANGTNVSMSALAAGDMTGQIAISAGGTGQSTAAAAYNALSPMTTKGDMEYDSAAATAARLAIGTAGQVLGVAAGVPAWGMGMTPLAATSTAGYTLVNGTGNIITWTAPSDGVLHRVMVLITMDITVNQTGGQIAVSFTAPDGTVRPSSQVQAAGQTVNVVASINGYVIQAGSTFTLKQGSALTAGASVLWAEIWGS